MKLSTDIPPKLNVRFFIKYIDTVNDPLIKAIFSLCDIYCGDNKLVLDFPRKYTSMEAIIKDLLDEYAYELTEFPFIIRFK